MSLRIPETPSSALTKNMVQVLPDLHMHVEVGEGPHVVPVRAGAEHFIEVTGRGACVLVPTSGCLGTQRIDPWGRQHVHSRQG
jgi:hypothetical protein